MPCQSAPCVADCASPCTLSHARGPPRSGSLAGRSDRSEKFGRCDRTAHETRRSVTESEVSSTGAPNVKRPSNNDLARHGFCPWGGCHELVHFHPTEQGNASVSPLCERSTRARSP